MLDLASSFKRIATVNQRSGSVLAQHIVIGFMARANDRVTRDIHRSTWMRTSWHADVVPVFAIEWSATAEHHSLLAELEHYTDLVLFPNASLAEKVRRWFGVALQRYPQATHIGKADMDTFIRAPSLWEGVRNAEVQAAGAALYYGAFIGAAQCRGAPKDTGLLSDNTCQRRCCCPPVRCEAIAQRNLTRGACWSYAQGGLYIVSRPLAQVLVPRLEAVAHLPYHCEDATFGKLVHQVSMSMRIAQILGNLNRYACVDEACVESQREWYHMYLAAGPKSVRRIRNEEARAQHILQKKAVVLGASGTLTSLTREMSVLHVSIANGSSSDAELEWQRLKMQSTSASNKSALVSVCMAAPRTERSKPPNARLVGMQPPKRAVHSIPRVFLVTDKVWSTRAADLKRTLAATHPGWGFRFFDDIASAEFLQACYGGHYVQAFRSFQVGAHRADFLRYALLYAIGGYYLDTDNRPLLNLQDATSVFDFVSAVGTEKQHHRGTGKPIHALHNGFVATRPKSLVTKQLLQHMLLHRRPPHSRVMPHNMYFHYVRSAYHLIKQLVNVSGELRPNTPYTVADTGERLLLLNETLAGSESETYTSQLYSSAEPVMFCGVKSAKTASSRGGAGGDEQFRWQTSLL